MQYQVALGAIALTLLRQGRHRPRSWLADTKERIPVVPYASVCILSRLSIVLQMDRQSLGASYLRGEAADSLSQSGIWTPSASVGEALQDP